MLRFNVTLFIKAQVTIVGILASLDPGLRQDDYLIQGAGRLVVRELSERFLYTL